MSAKKAGKTGRTKPLIVVAPAVAGSPSSDTPETDTLRQKLWGKGWSDSYMTMMSHANKLERERDELRAKYAAHHAEAEKLTEVIRAATVLIAAKGRHNTMLAYEGLRAALSPENADVEVSGPTPTSETPN